MSDETMVERVSAAIAATMFGEHELPLTGYLADRYRETARAAVQAMREPTEAMVNAAYEQLTTRIENGPHDLYAAWRAAIDAALSPQPERK